MRAEYLDAFLQQQSPEYFEEMAEEIALDRGQPIEADSAAVLLEDYLNADSIRRLGLFVAGLHSLINIHGFT